MDFHKCIHEFIESIGTIRQRVKTVPEEELGSCVDREVSGQVLKVNGLVGLETRDVVESPVDVLIEELEIGCPVVGKEWMSDCSVLWGKCHETREMVTRLGLTAFHSSPSRFNIPDPR